MSTSLVNVPVPQEIYERLEKAATRLEKSVPALLSDALFALLPNEDTIPTDIQHEVTQLDSLNIEALWQIAQSAMTETDQSAIEHLLYLQESRSLVSSEQKKLEALRIEYGRIMLRKARAFAILTQRGQSMPLFEG